jgi:hypothetical protein
MSIGTVSRKLLLASFRRSVILWISVEQAISPISARFSRHSCEAGKIEGAYHLTSQQKYAIMSLYPLDGQG